MLIVNFKRETFASEQFFPQKEKLKPLVGFNK